MTLVWDDLFDAETERRLWRNEPSGHDGLYRVIVTTMGEGWINTSDTETLALPGLEVKFSYSKTGATGEILKNSNTNYYEWTNGVFGKIFADNYIYVKASGYTSTPIFEKMVESPPIISGPTEISVKKGATDVFTYNAFPFSYNVTWECVETASGDSEHDLMTIDGNGKLNFSQPSTMVGSSQSGNIYSLNVKATSNKNGFSSEMKVIITVVDDATVEILGPSTIEIVAVSEDTWQFDNDHQTAILSWSETSDVAWVEQKVDGVLSISPPSSGLAFNADGSNTYTMTVEAIDPGQLSVASKDVTIKVINRMDFVWQTVAKVVGAGDGDNYRRFYRSSNSIVGSWRVKDGGKYSYEVTIKSATWSAQ